MCIEPSTKPRAWRIERRGAIPARRWTTLVETRQREYDTGRDEPYSALTGQHLRALVGGGQADDTALLAVRIDELPDPT